ncbi:peroxisome biogenesis factor 2 [Lingula anatina]|uniref:Peroxisome biogenesis factor 2 n=1 Tax=Lingula anatina TaxID=7574 RepID=A0A1S3JC59_LINAN|nr:peroxisome biogenesis factor 2 [Lingula anatina]|eukprot:XP_013407469.1 peroxisome biogenesis factor 2 [Lingula anatina]
MAEDTREAGVFPALRISQLDASELDHEVHSIFKTQLLKAFRYFSPGLLTKIEPEINAALRLLVWKFSLDAVEATIGQQMLGLRYKDNTGSSRCVRWISRKQRIWYAVLTVGGPWLKERSHDLSKMTQNIRHIDKFWKLLDWLSDLWKIATLANFLIFLQKGSYQMLIERILGIQAVFPRMQEARQVSFDYMSRELLWHGFAEFLFFMLPLINFRKIKNAALRLLLRPSSPGEPCGQPRCPADYKECAICGHWPNNPHQLGCRHVFCYYCIQSNVMADQSYSCPVCGQCVEEESGIQPVRMEDTKDL